MLRVFFLVYFFISNLCLGLDGARSFKERFADFKARAVSHENDVAYLLSQPPPPRSNFDLPPPPKNDESFPPEPQVDIPYLPVPDYNALVEDIDNNESVVVVEDFINEEGNQSVDNELGVEEAYAELYDTDAITKHEGFYLGAISGLIVSENVKVRKPSGTSASRNVSYDGESGYMLGFQVGHDFGFVKVEGEYSYYNFDAHSGADHLEARIHNIFSRFILEKDLSERVDLRLGLGMGMGIVDFEGVTDFMGTGFAYDFLLGTGYRLSRNWSLQMDYRYYLTAASEDYDHVKNHLILLSAGMDI